MNKKSAPLLYISLACGILFILLGIVFLLASSANPENVSISISSLVLLSLGAVALFLCLAVNHRAFFLYLGLNLCLFGVLSLALTFNIFNLTFYEVWPVGMIFCGVTLMPSGFFRFRKFRTAYIFPSISLTLLGILFCLFSFDVIKASFSKIVSLWWPIGLIILGSVLIAIFIIQKKNQASFPYMNEEDEEDELDDYDGAGEEL